VEAQQCVELTRTNGRGLCRLCGEQGVLACQHDAVGYTKTFVTVVEHAEISVIEKSGFSGRFFDSCHCCPSSAINTDAVIAVLLEEFGQNRGHQAQPVIQTRGSEKNPLGHHSIEFYNLVEDFFSLFQLSLIQRLVHPSLLVQCAERLVLCSKVKGE
jgi:hypothetical protein